MRKTHLLKGLFTGLFALALVLCAFGSFSASADAATPTKPTAKADKVIYVPATDSLKATDEKVVVYYVKKAADNSIKATTAYTELAANETVTLTELGAKSTTKDAYFIVVDKAYESDYKQEKANFTVKAQAAKKIVGEINYTKADNATADDVLTFTATDANKKAIGVTASQLRWSDDSWETVKESTAFTGKYLADSLEAGASIEIKMIGTEGNPAVRTSKAVKVKIAKQAKAPSVKFDAKKSTLDIKNGMDFAICTRTGTEGDYTYTANKWFTVLPYNKNEGAAAAPIVATSDWKPVDKKNATYKTWSTKTQYKAMTIDSIIDFMNKNASGVTGYAEKKISGDLDIMVRKSATTKKPASAAVGVTIKGQIAAPVVYTKELVKGETVIAEGTEIKFKALDIVNYPGTKKVESKDVLATTGYGADFKIDEDGTGADAAAAKYEMCVINAADLNTVDWTSVSWKSIKKGTSITAKTKTKYKVGTKTVEATFSKVGTSETDAPVFLLIRRAGVKAKNVSDSVQASAYVKTYLKKNGKTFIWAVENAGAIGDKAFKYTIKFQKWSLKSGSTTEYEYAVDSKIAEITGFSMGSTTVELPDVENAKYEIPTGGVGELSEKKDKVTFSITDAAVIVNVNIVENANITVTVKKDGNTEDKTSDLAKDAVVGTAKEITAAEEGYTATVTVDGVDMTDKISGGKIKVTANSTKTVKVVITYTKSED